MCYSSSILSDRVSLGSWIRSNVHPVFKFLFVLQNYRDYKSKIVHDFVAQLSIGIAGAVTDFAGTLNTFRFSGFKGAVPVFAGTSTFGFIGFAGVTVLSQVLYLQVFWSYSCFSRSSTFGFSGFAGAI